MQVSADANDQGVMLTVSGLKLSDSGQYVCALNTKHSVLSVVHTLNIEGKFPIKASLNPNPFNQAHYQHSTFLLLCLCFQPGFHLFALS